MRAKLHIIIRSYDHNQVFTFYNMKTNDIVRETFDRSLRAGRCVFKNLGLTDYEAGESTKNFYQHDKDATQDFAKLWDSKIPTLKNASYLALSKDIDKHLERTLRATHKTKNMRLLKL
ncbi:MAG: hypothetical protein P8M25_16655 [Paracoccaceae bacterium]|nr:hypothetical protein [Paracoccaceae bacterium]